ncbi:uncharacterized protein EV422DRAFT_506662 [Fimicolochytrium jonesii]|uniref:uncharacterized protein n=1 Tax=Fimicolochytrium jonesii TaxID=1396493 RepID=UPI0022FDB3C9|nr:uncharacterized protein EV422DRAFT_506662 [Fimicolochytrium jonesii]KAI8820415.1 hypothetical protein EV422DRAFT_506662 [Fimicolochytrium jonesii]
MRELRVWRGATHPSGHRSPPVANVLVPSFVIHNLKGPQRNSLSTSGSPSSVTTALSHHFLNLSSRRPLSVTWTSVGVRSLHATPIAGDVSVTPQKAVDPKQLIRKKLKAIGKPSAVPPKRPLSAYVLFANDQVPSIRGSLSDVPPTERIAYIGRTAGQRWKALDASEKQRYARKAEQERENYERAYKQYLSSRSAADILIEQKRNFLNKKLNPTTTVRRVKPATDAPKRPENIYASFTKQAYALSPDRQRQAFGSALSDLSFGEAGKVIATAFRSLPEEQRQKLKEQYDRAYSSYSDKRDAYERDAGIATLRKQLDTTTRLAIRPKRIVKRKKKTVTKRKLIKTRANKRVVKKKTAKKVAVAKKKKTAETARGVAKKAVRKAVGAAKKAVKAVKKVVKKAAPVKKTVAKKTAKKTTPKKTTARKVKA